MRTWFLMIAVLVLATGAEDEGPVLTLATERCIAFKNGYCLMVKRGVVTTDANGEAYTTQVPEDAVLGTVWATPTEGRLLSLGSGVRTRPAEKGPEVACTSHAALLTANLGRACTITTQDGAVHAGTIRSVLGEGILVLRGPDGDKTVNTSGIRHLAIPDMVVTAPAIPPRTEVRCLNLRLADANRRHEISLVYLRPGLRWIPTYRIDLAPDEARERSAHIAFQAEVVNDLEDLAGVPVDLVVGVPNFRFAGTPSPLAMQTGLGLALARTDPSFWSNRLTANRQDGNVLMTQVLAAVEPSRNPQSAGNGPDLPPELAAGGVQDLFVYHLDRLTLPRGQRALIPIFATDAAYRDLHTWTVASRRHDNEAAPAGAAGSPLVLARNDIWHQIELTNATGMPWTTGAVLVMQGGQPLAQELMTYTAAGASVRLPVTVAVDLRGSIAETETGRDLQALQYSGCNYARIAKQARLGIINRKRTPVEIEVAWDLGGAIDTISDAGEKVMTPFAAEDWVTYGGHPAVNNHAKATWRLQIPAGAGVAPTVDYHYFTR